MELHNVGMTSPHHARVPTRGGGETTYQVPHDTTAPGCPRARAREHSPRVRRCSISPLGQSGGGWRTLLPVHSQSGTCTPAGIVASGTHVVPQRHTPPPLAAPILSLSHLPGGGHAPGTMSFETGAYQDAVATLNPAGAPHPAPGDPSFAVRVKPVEAVFTLALSDSCAIPNHLSVQVRSVFPFLLHPSRCAPSV